MDLAWSANKFVLLAIVLLLAIIVVVVFVLSQHDSKW